MIISVGYTKNLSNNKKILYLVQKFLINEAFVFILMEIESDIKT